VTGTEGQFGTAAQNLQTEQTNLTLHNAFVVIDDAIWNIGAKLGRMYWGSKQSLVGYVGPYDNDNLAVLSVDGLMLKRAVGDFDLSYSQLTLADAKALSAVDAVGRVTYKGASVMTNINKFSGNEDVSIPVALTLHSANTNGASLTSSADNVNLGVYELNVGANLMDNMLKFGLDWGSNFGQRNVAVVGTKSAEVKFKGTLMALRGAFDHEDSGFGVSAEFANASGDDDNREPDGTVNQTSADDKSWHDFGAFGMVPYRHYGEILGNSDSQGLLLLGLNSGTPLTAFGQGRGFSVMALGLSYKPAVMDKKWKFALDWISADTAKKRPAVATAQTGLTAQLLDATTAKKGIGTELDLSASYMKSENVMFKFGYAQFSPEKNSAFLANGGLDDGITKYFANASVKF
jgi:hypothetical protein